MRGEAIGRIAAGLLLVAGVAYLVAKSLLSHDAESDFRFLWTAGRLWADGVDPYSEAFTTIGRRLFPGGNEIAWWLYPPQWWAICRPLAALSPAAALGLWRASNALLLPASGAALAEAAVRRLGLPGWAAVGFIGLLPLVQATPQVLASGQTTILVFAGYALLGRGLILQRSPWKIAGLALLFLKPQFGLVAVIALLVDRRHWLAIAAAGGMTALFCLPQLLVHGAGPTIAGFLHNLASYGQQAPNQPIRLTGAGQFAYRLLDVALPTSAAPLLSAVIAAALAWRVRRQADAPRAAATLLAIVAVTLFVQPLHSYDMVAAMPAILMAMSFAAPVRATVWSGGVLILHPAALAMAIGGDEGTAILILSVAMLLLFAGAVLAALSPTRALPRSS